MPEPTLAGPTLTGPTIPEKIIDRTLAGGAIGALLGFIFNRTYLWVLAKEAQACGSYPGADCESLAPIGYDFEGILIGVAATLVICIIGFSLIQKRTAAVSAAVSVFVTWLAAIFCRTRLGNLWIPVTVLAGAFALIAPASALTVEIGPIWPIWRRTKSTLPSESGSHRD
ncbi:MAG TPA: hypothetical protein VF444_25125 [Pseudonocardiaceae bacterium]